MSEWLASDDEGQKRLVGGWVECPIQMVDPATIDTRGKECVVCLDTNCVLDLLVDGREYASVTRDMVRDTRVLPVTTPITVFELHGRDPNIPVLSCDRDALGLLNQALRELLQKFPAWRWNDTSVRDRALYLLANKALCKIRNAGQVYMLICSKNMDLLRMEQHAEQLHSVFRSNGFNAPWYVLNPMEVTYFVEEDERVMDMRVAAAEKKHREKQRKGEVPSLLKRPPESLVHVGVDKPTEKGGDQHSIGGAAGGARFETYCHKCNDTVAVDEKHPMEHEPIALPCPLDRGHNFHQGGWTNHYRHKHKVSTWWPLHTAPGNRWPTLDTYANKHWNGLVKDFYLARVRAFMDQIAVDMPHKRPLDYSNITHYAVQAEMKFTNAHNRYPDTAQGDVIQMSLPLITKYGKYF